MRRIMNQKGLAEFAVLTAVSIIMWILTLGVVKGVKKEQPTVQVQTQQQEQAKQE